MNQQSAWVEACESLFMEICGVIKFIVLAVLGFILLGLAINFCVWLFKYVNNPIDLAWLIGYCMAFCQFIGWCFRKLGEGFRKVIGWFK